jgi:preprotein translocase subunit SecE
MKKTKTKPKTTPKEVRSDSPRQRGQVVKIKTGKGRPGWSSKVPPIKQYWSKTKEFLVESVQEMKKTSWPNRKETLTTTGVVLVLVFLLAGYLGLVDFILSHFLRYFIH